MVSSFDSFNLSFKNPVNLVILSKKQNERCGRDDRVPDNNNYSTDILPFVLKAAALLHGIF
jgi:hypothetical protein